MSPPHYWLLFYSLFKREFLYPYKKYIDKPAINHKIKINQLLTPSSLIKYKFTKIPITGKSEKLNLKLNTLRMSHTIQKTVSKEL